MHCNEIITSDVSLLRKHIHTIHTLLIIEQIRVAINRLPSSDLGQVHSFATTAFWKLLGEALAKSSPSQP